MLLNLSSDVPFIYRDWEIRFFERRSLEEQLPKYFYENKDLLANIYVISWPWYFSSTRVGVEVINILKVLWIVKNIYFLNKLDFFKELWFKDIYLFSGNKNKFIDLEWNVILKKNLNNQKQIEELFELKLENFEMIKYKEILKNYKNLKWDKIKKQGLLKPFYIFEPIVC